MNSFFKLTLRTSDVVAARAFYETVLGPVSLEVVQLHEGAVARGARPHWLGFIEVSDVDAAAAAFAARGATALAPKWINPAGLEAAVMRDPGGAIVALGKPPANASQGGPPVASYFLNTNDVSRAQANYRASFGWDFAAALDLGELGVIHPFSWAPGLPVVGGMREIASRPGVHPHWLFHFPVVSIDRAIDAVRAAGGLVLGPVTLPGGEQIAVCDDPQGAAFALRPA